MLKRFGCISGIPPSSLLARSLHLREQNINPLLDAASLLGLRRVIVPQIAHAISTDDIVDACEHFKEQNNCFLCAGTHTRVLHKIHIIFLCTRDLLYLSNMTRVIMWIIIAPRHALQVRCSPK